MSDKINILHQTTGPVHASVGHELVLKLVVSTSDFKDYIVEWKLNGQSVPADQVADPDQSLYIAELTQEQFGTYTARVKLKENPLDYVDIDPILVERIPFIAPQDQSPTYIYKRIGEELDVFATPIVEAGYTFDTIWYKDHVMIDPSKVQAKNVHVDRVSREDFGNYTCKVFVVEDARAYYRISPVVVEENDKPPVIHIEEHYSDTVTVLEDDRLDLEVTVRSDDATRSIEYTWIHNGKKIIEQDGTAMIIPYVTQADAGIWRLEVRQGGTVVYSKDCNVVVSGRSYFRISRQPLNTNVPALTPAVLSVDYVTNYTNVKIQWLRQKKEEGEFTPIVGETEKELKIIPATNDVNEAKFKARITYGNNQVIESSEATLLVGESPVITITQQPQPINNVRVSSSQTLTCRATSNYEHFKLDYQWYKDNELIPNKTSDSLHFSAITKADEGRYKCVVSMGISNHRIVKDSDEVQVTVDASKSTMNITKQPHAISVRSGGVWTISVEATSNDALPVRYRWFKDGKDLFPTGVEQRNSYGEDHAQITSSGVYTCRVSAGFGEHRVSQMTNPARVIITDDPSIVENDTRITIHPQDAHVNLNQRVILHAQATNTIGIKPTYQWKKDGVIIPGENSETLIIEHVKPSDVGRYTSVITAAETTVETNPAEITMAPHQNINIIKHPVDVVAKEGQKQDVTLEAHAEHVDDDKVVSWQWHKVKGGVDQTILGATQKVLTIPHGELTKDSHEATYYAVIKDDEGHVAHTEKVRIVFTKATLKRYVHPIPWRRTSFQYQGYWVMDEIERCLKSGLNWLEDFEHTKYPEEIETIAASLHHYSNTHVLESRNGYLIDGTQLF